ncbi:TPA: helix-turn-helix transcriptional regulator [Enterobacter kobei]|nr:helix-turn-helix transcriptional regulator [Enterobacter kobei]
MSTQYYLKTLNQLRPVLVGFRKVRGLTQKELSGRLGVTQQTYARLEANPATASFERLYKVFSLLGVELVLSSREPLADSKPQLISKQQDTALPARRESW